MTINFLTILALGTAVLHLWGEYRGPRWLVYGAKPTTTTLILLMAFSTPHPVSAFYQWAIVTGLLFSLAGDIFLMLPADQFVAGLVSFLLAHLCYIGAFGAQVSWPPFSWWGVLVVIYSLGVYRFLAPSVGKLCAPVLVYMATISLMAWLAIVMAVQQGAAWTMWAASGAVLFVLSDSALALNRFRQPFWSAQLIVLGTYYMAQWLIALSV